MVLPAGFWISTALLGLILVNGERIPLPAFSKLKLNYPGYRHHGGLFNNHQIIRMIGCSTELLLHDTSALRMSYSLNKIGSRHSLGKELIRLSKYGRDSVTGKENLQYLYHPIAYGPYLADKYGYPSVSKLHQLDPIDTKKNFWGKQGILRVITYTKEANKPKGHVALWDCNHFHQSKDWISGHSLITVEFWESPDSDCSAMNTVLYPASRVVLPPKKPKLLKSQRQPSWRRKLFKKYYAQNSKSNVHFRHHGPINFKSDKQT